MIRVCLVMAVIGFVLAGPLGCVTTQQWETFKSHPTMYASGKHLWFSWKNCDLTRYIFVSEDDLIVAEKEDWWGDPVVQPKSD